MKIAETVRQTIALHLDDVPGVHFAYTAKPWRLWLVKPHAFFQENRPLSPTLDSEGALKRFVAKHAGHLQQQAVAAAASGFDHGAGALLPDPPPQHQPEQDLTRVGWNERHALLQQIQETVRRPPLKVAVDLRHLELLGEDGIEGDLFDDAGDAWQLTLGPLQVVMEMDQVGEVLHALLELYVGGFAPILMTILDRLPDGAYGAFASEEQVAEWDRVVGALWLAVDSYRELWPLRRGGYDDTVWNVQPPPKGVTVHTPLGEGEYYRPPNRRMDVDDLRSNLRKLLRRTPRPSKGGPDGVA